LCDRSRRGRPVEDRATQVKKKPKKPEHDLKSENDREGPGRRREKPMRVEDLSKRKHSKTGAPVCRFKATGWPIFWR